MVCARIADDGTGAFSAHVEHAQSEPFCFMGGPVGVTLDDAVAWGRKHAAKVVVRVGDVHYSAGTQPVGILPALPETRAGAVAPAATGPATRWRATARTGWYRDDRGEVARRFEQALELSGGAVDATVVVDEAGFSTSFTVASRSDLGAHEIAFGLARDAWATLGVVAEPGVDFDVSRFEVTPAGGNAG